MTDKEKNILKNHIKELAAACWDRDIPTCTDFLTLEEQAVFSGIRKELPPVKTFLTGGYEAAERKLACFLPSYAEEDAESYLPLRILEARPRDMRFAESLTHRDYLGALMNLGIERGQVGDLVLRDGICYLYAKEQIASFLCLEYTRVRHTDILCAPCDDPVRALPEFRRISESVSSLRLDAVAAAAFHKSRSFIQPLIEGGKAFVDGAEVLSPDRNLREGAVVSIRGLGKFRFLGTGKETRKGRIFVELDLFA